MTHSGEASGGEIALSRLVLRLRDRGVANVVACGSEGRLADALRAEGVSVVVIVPPGGLADRRAAELRGLAAVSAVPSALLYAIRLGAAARRFGADVIHTNSMKAHVAGMVAGWSLRRPVIVHLRDDLAHVKAGASVTTVLGWLLRRVPSMVVGCSRHVLDAAATGRRPTAVVYSGVPTEMVLGRPVHRDGPPVVGMVARIAEWKGQHLFLEAAAMVAPARPGVRFRIVGAPLFGEAPYLDRLRRLAAVGELADRVEFTGFTSDTAHEYDRMAVAVACSIEPEPFGQVVVEAMARGCAVIAPAEGGPREVITPDVDGVLVAPRDAGALADAILGLLDDEPRRALLGARAVETIKARFTVDVTAESFLEVLEGLGR